MIGTAQRLGRLGVAVGLIAILTPLSSARAVDQTVTITDTLAPRDITVAPGTTIEWINLDGERHKIRSVTGPEEFDGDLDPGDTFTFNFAIEGTYSYIDDRNDEDTAYYGTVNVTAAQTRPDRSR